MASKNGKPFAETYFDAHVDLACEKRTGFCSGPGNTRRLFGPAVPVLCQNMAAASKQKQGWLNMPSSGKQTWTNGQALITPTQATRSSVERLE